MALRTLLLLAAALVLLAPAAVAQPVEEAAAPRRLAWMLEPGEARSHTVALELDTRLTAASGTKRSERRTRTAMSCTVSMFGLRRERAEQDGAYIDTVVELTVDDFHLEVVSESDDATITVTMDDEGMTVRHGQERPTHVPWTSVPPRQGGQVGELLGRTATCSISREGQAVRIDGRMAPWTQVLDSIDLLPLITPLVPLPDEEVEPGSIWVRPPSSRPVTLSQPWEKLNLATRPEVKVTAFERHKGVDAARLAFTCTARLADVRPRLDYTLEIKGEMLVGFDGAVLEGTATVTLEAKTTVVDTDYVLTGIGTLRFGRPAADSDAGAPRAHE
jgi:hypothetical protein